MQVRQVRQLLVHCHHSSMSPNGAAAGGAAVTGAGRRAAGAPRGGPGGLAERRSASRRALRVVFAAVW